MINHNRNVAIIQVDNVNTYQYTQPIPEISWQTVEGDTTICDVACRKAVCRFGGRGWTAWYAPTFDLHTGPYLFGGLPGLIFSICDTKDNYRFTLNGLENLRKECPYISSRATKSCILRVTKCARPWKTNRQTYTKLSSCRTQVRCSLRRQVTQADAPITL